MKKQTLFLVAVLIALFTGCKSDDADSGTNPILDDIDYRQEMRNFVKGISDYTKGLKPGFVVIPQNGIELISENGEEDGSPVMFYLNAIDAVGQEDLNYGYNNDNQATPANETAYLNSFLAMAKQNGKTVMVADYCSTHSKMDDSYSKNSANGYISFAANHRELDNIPDYPQPIYHENDLVISNISQARNYLYLLNLSDYPDKQVFISAVSQTNYDLLVMDLFAEDDTQFTAQDINQLRNKANGGKRMVIAYMSIGEAENYRYYWKAKWNTNPPAWLGAENPDWDGNFKVKYWEPDWQKIIYGNENSYVKKIIDAGFDGVYLDIIDAFEYYE